MLYLGFAPGAAGWQAQTDPLSYGGRPSSILLYFNFFDRNNSFGCWDKTQGDPLDATPCKTFFYKICFNPALFFVNFRPFHITNQLKIEESIDGVLGI